MSGDHAIPAGADNEKRLKLVLGMTGTYLVAEVVGGLMTGSLALLSDAAHMMTDVMALVIALIAIRIGRRVADAKRTYGYRRFEILAAALNAVVLFLVALYILVEAYKRFQNPPDIQSGAMMAVAAVGLLVNIISMRMLSKGSENSLNMKGAYLEVLSDMVGSVGVILAGLIIKYTGWWQVDPILAVLIGLWVLPRTWTLLSESLNVLLEGIPKGLEMEKLIDELKAIDGVVEVHDVHVWAITSGSNTMTAHLVVNTYPNDDTVRRKALEVVERHHIEHSTFQIEAQAEVGKNHLNGY